MACDVHRTEQGFKCGRPGGADPAFQGSWGYYRHNPSTGTGIGRLNSDSPGNISGRHIVRLGEIKRIAFRRLAEKEMERK